MRDIHASYRKLAKIYHPDRLTSSSNLKNQEKKEYFYQIQEAYATLKEPEKRNQYDTQGVDGLINTNGARTSWLNDQSRYSELIRVAGGALMLCAVHLLQRTMAATFNA